MTQRFRDEDMKKAEKALISLESDYEKLLSKIFKIKNVFKNKRANEYLLHGIARRLGIIKRCIENIYSIFPLKRERLLSRNELTDIVINLHAFLVNTFGLLDNITIFTNSMDNTEIGLPALCCRVIRLCDKRIVRINQGIY